MNDQDLLINKRARKAAADARKARATTIARPWPGGEIEPQEETAVPLSTARLQALSRKGLWGLLLFLLVSVGMFLVQEVNLYTTLPEPVLQFLGCPPPAFLTHLALTAYSFTVVVPVLIRMATGAPPAIRWHHLACRAIFYPFYLVANALPQNFLVVLGIGVVLYLVEQCGLWVSLRRQSWKVTNSGLRTED